MLQMCLSASVGGGGQSHLCGTSGPCGNKSSESVTCFMCTELCFAKSLGDWHGLEESCVRLKKIPLCGLSSDTEAASAVYIVYIY